jgi:hypothetical protein
MSVRLKQIFPFLTLTKLWCGQSSRVSGEEEGEERLLNQMANHRRRRSEP